MASAHIPEMVFLLWTVLLTTLLWVQPSKAVDETELAALVTNLVNVYRPEIATTAGLSDTPTFTLAASIPYNAQTGRYDLSQVTAVDEGQIVRQQLGNCQVYEGNRLVGAMVLKWPTVKTLCPNAIIPAHWSFVRELCPGVETWGALGEQCTNNMNKKLLKSPNGAADHAEYRVLENFNTFLNRLNNGQLNRNDLMLFYSYKAPCDSRCASLTNNFSIIQSIGAINNWPNHVLVFSDIFVPSSNRPTLAPSTVLTNRRTALTNLGNAINGLGNIYRCPAGVGSTCTSCRGLTGVSDTCVN